MYIPPAFLESDLKTLQAFIEQHSFGQLISQVDGQPFASHIPFLLERAVGQYGSLIGHTARANPHLDDGEQAALAIFSGPHAYISPTWYEAENVVPTWNYVAVHVYGRIQIIDDQPTLLKIVHRTTTHYERTMPAPWSFDGRATFVERLLPQIIGFRIEIERIEGKWKLNQNHPVERQEKVIRALQERKDENSQGIAKLMSDGLRKRNSPQ